MNKFFFQSMLIALSIASLTLSADRQESEIACPSALKELLALADGVTKLDLSQLNIINDEVADFGRGVPVTELIAQVGRMEENDRARIQVLDIHSSLLGNSGFREVAENLIPLFPSLTILKLVCDGIDESDTAILYNLLKTQFSLKFVDIMDNGITKQVRYDVGNGLNAEDKERVVKKVIVSPKSQVEDMTSLYPQWRETHESFYKLQEAH